MLNIVSYIIVNAPKMIKIKSKSSLHHVIGRFYNKQAKNNLQTF